MKKIAIFLFAFILSGCLNKAQVNEILLQDISVEIGENPSYFGLKVGEASSQEILEKMTDYPYLRKSTNPNQIKDS